MKNILIVDDDIDIGNVVEEVLAKAGYLTARAYSGTEAVLYLSSQKPDLVLLDLMLPGLSGEDILPRGAEGLSPSAWRLNGFRLAGTFRGEGAFLIV